MKIYDTIYLQYGIVGDVDTTWCEDKINDDDVEYTLAKNADALRAENEQLRGALNEAITAIRGLIGIITPKQASRFPNNMARAQKVLIGKKDGGE